LTRLPSGGGGEWGSGGCEKEERDFQFKKYPKISCSAGIWSPNNTRTGKIPLDHFFCGVLLSKKFPVEERYSLTEQSRRSSRSVCANMAEAGRKRRYEAALINHPSRWLMNHKNHKY